MLNHKILDKQLPNLPKEIKFCKRCVISNQRPRIVFDEEGICSACKFTEIKERGIDWDEREAMLVELCDRHRSKSGKFDVVVPCSGGKDGSRVAHELKYRYGMHPLTITFAPFEYTPIGYKNHRNFTKIGGFTNLTAWQNGRLHRKLARICFEAVGDAFQAFTFGQAAYAFHMAKAFNIDLVFFGENGEAEYSGDPKVFNVSGMPLDLWSEKYFKGVTIRDIVNYGLTETDYLSEGDFDESDLTFYEPPETGGTGPGAEFHWFSYYRKWIPQENYYYSAENTGFQANPEGRSEGTYSKYASLDDRTDGFHYYMAFMKFGICRATADAAHEVRDGHIDRREAAALVRRYDGEFPGRWFKDFLEYLDITEEHFWGVLDRFRSPHVWKKEGGIWKLRKAVYDEYGESDEVPVYISSVPRAN